MEVIYRRLVYIIVFISVIHSSNACPGQCSCSIQEKTVSCYGKKLSHIPDNIPLDVETLDLKSNNIAKITKSAFQKFKKLKKIELDFNQIATIEAGTFDNLNNLEVITLGTNSLTALPKGVFWNIPNLKIIDVTNNYITDISDGFKNITRITRLDFNGNAIQSIKKLDFRQIASLLDLILSNNNISKIDRFSFRPLTNLAYLSLKGNPLQRADGLLIKNKRLTYVDLSECQLKSVPRGLPRGILHLQLNRNNITKIKANDFKNKINLQIIVLDENQVQTIAPNSFSMQKNLKQLWLNANRLRKFPSPLSNTITNLLISKNQIDSLSPSDFPKNSMMTDLVMNGNPLSSIKPNTFENLKLLKNMWINSNKMTTLSDNMFSGLRNLKLLSISNTQISTIESECFSGLDSLNELSLASSMSEQITLEGNVFKNLPNLKILDIGSSEGLAKIILSSREIISSIQNIAELNIQDNNLNTLNSSTLKKMSNLKVMKLGMNRWHCDKQLSWMSTWLKENEDIVHMKDEVTCFTPTQLRKKKIADLKPEEFVDVTTTITPTTPKLPTTDIFQVSNLIDIKTEPARHGDSKKITRSKITTTIKPNFHQQTSTSKWKVKKTSTRITNKPTSPVLTSEIVREIITERARMRNKQTTHRENDVTSPTSPMYSTQDDFSKNDSATFSPADRNSDNRDIPADDNYMSTNHSSPSPNNTTVSQTSGVIDGKSKQLEEDAANRNLIIIIIATTLSLLIMLVIIIVIVIICRKREKVVYHRALQYDKDNGDVVFFVGDNPPCVATINKPPSRNNSRSRSERGSTSSRPSEDIMNELESTMKIYSLDEE